MKKVILFLGLFLLCLTSCKKDCTASDAPGCKDIVPTDEACLAYFERWFFDQNSNSYEKIGYSGCEVYGFATKEDCEECQCD